MNNPVFCFNLENALRSLRYETGLTQALVPFMMYLSPSSFAVVEAAPASLPFPGSDRQKQPIFSPVVNGVMNLSFCSSFPYSLMGLQEGFGKLLFKPRVVNGVRSALNI